MFDWWEELNEQARERAKRYGGQPEDYISEEDRNKFRMQVNKKMAEILRKVKAIREAPGYTPRSNEEIMDSLVKRWGPLLDRLAEND